MSSPHAYKETRLGASHTYPSSGVPFLEKELPKAGSAATAHWEICTKLAAPKDLGSSLSFSNLLCDPVQVTFLLKASIPSFIKVEDLVRHHCCYRWNCVPPQNLHVEILTSVP